MKRRCMFCFVGGVLLTVATKSFAKAPPGLPPDPERAAWFTRQYNINGGSCCGLSDGHVLEDNQWKIAASEVDAKVQAYFIQVEQRWYEVPPGNMTRDYQKDPNPTGKAVAWYSIFRNMQNEVQDISLFCFTPGWVA